MRGAPFGGHATIKEVYRHYLRVEYGAGGLRTLRGSLKEPKERFSHEQQRYRTEGRRPGRDTHRAHRRRRRQARLSRLQHPRPCATRHVRGGLLPPAVRRAPGSRAAPRVRREAQGIAHHPAAGDRDHRAREGRAPDGHPAHRRIRGRRAGREQPRSEGRCRAAGGHPADRAGGHDRRDDAPPARRPRSGGAARGPEPRRELPLHDVRPGAVARRREDHRPGPRAARRAQLERVDLRRARCRRHRRRHRLGHRRGDRDAEGPPARRRRRGRAEDRRGDRRPGARDRLHPREDRGGREGDGLRPPRLQERGPARTRAEGRRAGAGPPARQRPLVPDPHAGREGDGAVPREGHLPERRLLRGGRVLAAGHPGGAVHPDVRRRPHARLGRARPGAVRRQRADPPAAGVHGPAPPPLRPDRRALVSAFEFVCVNAARSVEHSRPRL